MTNDGPIGFSKCIRLSLVVVAFSASTLFADPPDDKSNMVSAEEIAKLVAGLGDTSYETRTVAFRQLCVIGVDAREALEKAAGGPDAEASIRATQLLSIFQQLLFTGCQVTLEFSKQEIVWNEPVDLRITIANRSKYDAPIPFDLPGGSGPALEGDARQVADLLDASEYLRVRAADGKDVELRMDDLGGDAQVMQALQSRLDDRAMSRIPAGRTVQVTIRDFNRGWARYAFLDAGEYTVVMDYRPEWEDTALLTTPAGRVLSNTARLRIKDGAPPGVSRGGSQAELAVEPSGDAFVANLVNRTDQPLVINANFGGTPPFADGRWTIESEGHRGDIGVPSKPMATWSDFDSAKLIEVGPGTTVELTRIPVARIRQAAKEIGGENGSSGWTLHFAYSNLCDRNWQARQGDAFAKDTQVPKVLKEPLSRRLLNTRIASERKPLPTSD